MKHVFIPALVSLLLVTPLHAESWPQFRGPGGEATLERADGVPFEWSGSTNLKWKVALPGPGSSSPVFHEDKLFVTCYTGYAVDKREPGEPANLGRQLLCFDRQTGKKLWARSVALLNGEDDYRGYIMEHGYASSTPVTDGKNVYAFFGKSGVHAFTVDGKELWQKQVGSDSGNRRWGSGASPVLFGDLLVVNAADEGRAVIAFDKMSGEERWRFESRNLELAYGTPRVRDIVDGKKELVLAVPTEMWGLDLATGKQNWSVRTNMPGNICPSVAVRGDMLVAFGGYPRKSSVAVKDGRIEWTGAVTTYVPTPLVFGDHLYWVNDDAEAICMETATGKIITKRKVEGMTGSRTRSFYASLVRVGDRFIATSRTSGVFIFEAKPDMKQVAHNSLGDESDFNATPAVATDALYLRSNQFLYCVGK